jgi:hypothetical protein
MGHSIGSGSRWHATRCRCCPIGPGCGHVLPRRGRRGRRQDVCIASVQRAVANSVGHGGSRGIECGRAARGGIPAISVRHGEILDTAKAIGSNTAQVMRRSRAVIYARANPSTMLIDLGVRGESGTSSSQELWTGAENDRTRNKAGPAFGKQRLTAAASLKSVG